MNRNKDTRLGWWPSFLNISTDKMSQSEHNSSTMRSAGSLVNIGNQLGGAHKA